MRVPVSKTEWAELRRQTINDIDTLKDKLGVDGILLGYQRRTVRLLESGTELLVIEKSRRIGLTWGFAAFAALRAGKAKKAGGMDVMYISYSQEMTREFIDACAMFAQAYSIAAMAAEEFLFDDHTEEGDRSIQAFRIRFDSGFEIIALSSAPRSLRGKQGVVMIDEAAFVDNLQQLLKSALAFLMWGGQVVVCSTHDGVDNDFNQLVQDVLGGRQPGEHLHISLDEALEDGLYERIALITGREVTPEAEAQWRQKIIDFYGQSADEELFCIPTMGSGTWLSSPLIEARMTAPAPVLRLDLPPDYLHRPELERITLLIPFMEELEERLERISKNRRFAFGFDVGRVSDLSSGSLLSIEDNLKREEVLSFELRRVPFAEQETIVEMILDSVRARLVSAAFDATGIGMQLSETMGRKYGLRETEDGDGVVIAVKFSQDWYRLNMPPLKVAFEDAMIALGPDAEHVSDLRLVKVIRGIPMLPPTREGEKNKKRHGDYAIALALAHYASRQAWSEIGYTPVPPQRSKFDQQGGAPNSGRDAPFSMRSLRNQLGIMG